MLLFKSQSDNSHLIYLFCHFIEYSFLMPCMISMQNNITFCLAFCLVIITVIRYYFCFHTCNQNNTIASGKAGKISSVPVPRYHHPIYRSEEHTSELQSRGHLV